MSPAPRRRAGLARRALPALVLTGASGAFLPALNRPSGADGHAATPTGGVTVVTVPTTSTAPVVTTIPPAVTTVPVPAGNGTGTPTTVAIPTSTAVPETTAAPVTTAAPATTCITYDGPVAMTKWGPVQVEATVAADARHDLLSGQAIQTPNDHRQSGVDQRIARCRCSTQRRMTRARTSMACRVPRSRPTATSRRSRRSSTASHEHAPARPRRAASSGC